MTIARTSTFVGARPVPRPPAAPCRAASSVQPVEPQAQARTLRGWPRGRLIQLFAAYADRAHRDRAHRIAFMLETAGDALVALEAADNRVLKAERERDIANRSAVLLEQALIAERAKAQALLAQMLALIGGDRFDEETVNRQSPLIGQERRTDVVDAPAIEGTQAP